MIPSSSCPPRQPDQTGQTRRRAQTHCRSYTTPWGTIAQADGTRRRVFCASMADVFDNQVPTSWRVDLWSLIRSTSGFLLTKRPQNIGDMLPTDWGEGWPNVWLGTTTKYQEEANRCVPYLVAVPAAV